MIFLIGGAVLWIAAVGSILVFNRNSAYGRQEPNSGFICDSDFGHVFESLNGEQ